MKKTVTLDLNEYSDAFLIEFINTLDEKKLSNMVKYELVNTINAFSPHVRLLYYFKGDDDYIVTDTGKERRFEKVKKKASSEQEAISMLKKVTDDYDFESMEQPACELERTLGCKIYARCLNEYFGLIDAKE